MKLIPAFNFFKKEIQEVVEQGHSIESVHTEFAEDGDVLVTAESPDGSVLVAVCVNHKLVFQQMLELIFAQTAVEIEALHRLKTMPSAYRHKKA